MMPTKRPSWVHGLVAGLLVTPVLIVLFVLGERLAGLPLLPFDLFDTIGRVLPGPIITLGIDGIVGVVRLLGLDSDLSRSAKLAEQILALFIFYGLSVVVAAAFFALMNRFRPIRSTIPGLVLGLTYGVPLMLMSLAINRSATAETLTSSVWIVLLIVGWGMIVGMIYDVLAAYATADDMKVQVQGLNRRQFLVRVGGASATLTVIGAGLGTLLSLPDGSQTIATADPNATPDPDAMPLPNASDAVQPAPGTRLEVTPIDRHYRIDISALPPVIDEASYTLKIHGAVTNPVAWTLADIRAMSSRQDYITMSCISNPLGGSLIGTTLWTGVSFQQILEQVQPTSEAVALRITAADNFDEYVWLRVINEDERVMLAYEWDNAPLTTEHGFPLRIHIPNRYGMKQPKWITDIEVVTEMGDGYWVRRGWSAEAMVRATSVIDTVAAEAIYEQDGQYLVPVGGIAWSGGRGISRVEVRVDDGEWQAAQLRAPLSERTWYLWRYDWPFTEGDHSFAVRCVEGDGTPQIEVSNDVRPDGATGVDRQRASLSFPTT